MSIQAVASAVSAMQNVQVQNQISVAVAGKQLDVMEDLGEAAVQLVEAALEVAKSQHTGQLFDAKA